MSGQDPAYVATLRRVVLQAIDMYWVEHLETMDYMRSSVNLRAYGQRDPLVEYKREGLQLFKDMEVSIEEEIKKLVPQITTEVFVDTPRQFIEKREDSSSTSPQPSSVSPTAKTPDGAKIGRNDPCFCGSGKKYKNCHGK